MTIKKSLSILLSIMITVAMTMSVFAMGANENVEPLSTCISHTYGSSTKSFHYEYLDSDSHALVVVTTRVCTKCGHVSQDSVKNGVTKSHDKKGVSSSCNGSTQTLVYLCDDCVTLFNESQPCPKKPHQGDCRWLPF